MSQYLLNTDVASSDLLALKSAVAENGKKVVEIAECVYQVPLPWLACFKQSDLAKCQVETESGEPVTFNVPVVSVEEAVQNLRGALPLFEHLTGENSLALEYWKAAIAGLERLELPYLTMDLSDLLSMSSAEELDEDLFISLGRTPAAVDHLKDTLLAYNTGKLPYPREAFYASRGITDDDRIQNTVALDVALDLPGTHWE